MKICTRCKQEKDSYLFCKHKANKDGLHCYCKNCQRLINAEWRKNNPDKAKKSCTDWVKRNPKTMDKIRRLPGQRFSGAKSAAKRRGLEWTISREDFEILITKPCEYCLELFPNTGSGLDRKDSNLGYIITNVVPCCVRCNKMKNMYLTYDEMKMIWKVRLNNM